MDHPDQNNFREALTQNMAELNEDEVLAIVKERMAQGENPFHIVETCRGGRAAGGRAVRAARLLSFRLIMAGEIFQEVMRILGPAITDQYKGNELGSILLGTVAGDIHNLGKNILSMLLTSYGFTVRDRGEDVTPEEFVQNALEMHPGAVGLRPAHQLGGVDERDHRHDPPGRRPPGSDPDRGRWRNHRREGVRIRRRRQLG